MLFRGGNGGVPFYKVPLSQGPSYVWRWLAIVMITGQELIWDKIREWAGFKVDSALEVILSSNIRVANSWARIKPTAPLSAFNKENSIEFPLNFLHYLYNYYMVCALLSHGHHVTTLWCHMFCDCDLWSWSCDTFPHSPSLCSKSKKKKKRNINNDLAVLPSHNTYIFDK